MSNILPTASVLPSILPDYIKDDDPLERPVVKILEFEHYSRSQPTHDKHVNEIVTFPIIVDASLSAEAQNIVNRSCGDSVSSLKVEHLHKKHQSKIWISLKAAAYNIALHAIILGLPGAELGPVIHLSTSLQG